MTDPDLWRRSASSIAQAIRAKDVSSVEAVAACLERTAAVNPMLNALVDIYGDDALAAAAEADKAVAAGAALGPLHGVPISIKDNVDEAGRVNSDGLPSAAEAVMDEDAPVVRNLRAAGAISIGRSNVPALSMRWFTDNDLYGRTFNPWNRAKTPGGSSGGAAAAVATGMVPLAHGNDIGGSVRYPAHVCGVMGLRPTVGRIPTWTPTEAAPALALSSALMSVEGVLARTVVDLELGLLAMARPDFRDPACVPGAFVRRPALDPQATTLGLVRTVGGSELDPVQNAALDQAATRLRDAGFRVQEIEMEQLAEAARLWLLLLSVNGGANAKDLRQLAGEAAARNFVNNTAIAHEMWGEPTLELYVNALSRRNVLVAEAEDLLARHRVVVLPASAAVAPDHDADQHPDTARALTTAQWPNTAIPALGLPALTLPTGIDDGMPMGVQLLGGRFDESALFDVAAEIERRTSPLTPIDPAW